MFGNFSDDDLLKQYTPGALAAFERTSEKPQSYLARHHNKDWGELLCDEDKASNDFALEHGLRLLSAYHLKDGTKIYVITEWDVRRVTI